MNWLTFKSQNMSLYRDNDNNDIHHHTNTTTTPINYKIDNSNDNNLNNNYNDTEESINYELYENDNIDGRIFLQLLSSNNNDNLTIMNQFKLECINRLCHIYGKIKVINKNNDKIKFLLYECSMELANKYNIQHYNYHNISSNTTIASTTTTTTTYNTTCTNHKLNDINIPSYLTPIHGSELIVSEFNNDCPIDSIKFIIINCNYNSNTYKHYNNNNNINNINNNNSNNTNTNNIFNQNANKSKDVCLIKTFIKYKSIHDIIIPIPTSSSLTSSFSSLFSSSPSSASFSSSSSNNFNNNNNNNYYYNTTHTNYKIIEVLFDKMTIFRSKISLPSNNPQFNHEVISQSPNQFIPYKLPTPIYVSKLSRSSSFSLVHPSSSMITSTTTTTTIPTTPSTPAYTTAYTTTNTSTTITPTSSHPAINNSTPSSSSSSSASISTTIACNNNKQSRQIYIRIINFLTYICRNKLLEIFLSFLIFIIWLIIRSNYITSLNNNNNINNNIMINNIEFSSSIINNDNNINNNNNTIDTTTISDYQYFMIISITIMIISWLIIFTFRNYILVFIQNSLFLPKLLTVSYCNGKVFFVNGWNAWSYCGAVLQGK